MQSNTHRGFSFSYSQSIKIIILKMIEVKPARPMIGIQIHTWVKDSHSLFNYKSLNTSQTKKKQYEFPLNVNRLIIARNSKTNQSIIILEKQAAIIKEDKSMTIIAEIRVNPIKEQKKIQFTIFTSKNSMLPKQNSKVKEKYEDQEKAGVVVSKQLNSKGEQKGYNIRPGQILCFGKIKYLVRQVKISNRVQSLPYDKLQEYYSDVYFHQQAPFKQNKVIEDMKTIQQFPYPKMEFNKRSKSKNLSTNFDEVNQTNLNIPNQQDSQDNENKTQISIKTQSNIFNQQQPQCRICFDSSSTKQNRLINVCKCTGSCKYTHFKCLKSWIQARSVVQSRQYCTSIEKVWCQICKAYLPMSFKVNKSNEQYVIIQKPSINSNYVMLQKIGSQKNILILKNPPLDGIHIGRDKNSVYVNLNDITISRVHSYINYSQGYFSIFDRDSKFGTVVQEQPLQVKIGTISRGIQIGRTYLQIKIKRDEKFLVGC